MKNKCILILLFISIITVIGIIWIINNPFSYDNNYWKEIGIGKVHLYNEVVNEKGRPIEIIKTDNQSTAIYDDVQFVWNNSNFKGVFIRVEITSSNVLLGPKKICLGMEREYIEKIYDSFFIKKLKDGPIDRLTYVDGNTWVTFIFDANSIVSKIMLSTGI